MTDLTPKQEKFAQAYIETGNALAAATIAEIDLPECDRLEGYYVYLLTDSRNGNIFYVGKGKGRRFASHLREWQTRRTVNPFKSSRIGQIVEGGGTVVARCLASGLSERAAFGLERATISALGRDRLTNATPGQTTAMDRAMYDARIALKRVKPYCRWVAERHRSTNDRHLYWDIIGEYHYIASGRWARDIEPYRERIAI